MQYFWYWRPKENWPPPAKVRPDHVSSGDRLTVSCTQTGLPAREQRALIRAWCDLLPNLRDVRFAWFSSRMPQPLFEAACRMPGLEGLYIKWSGITDLSAIGALRMLRHLHVGQSSLVPSIEPLADLRGLRSLGLELLSKVRDLEPLGSLTNLEQLSLEGSMGTSWRVDGLAPIGRLTGLRYLSIANLRAGDASLEGLFSLRELETFRHAAWWDPKQIAEIRQSNPGLVQV